MNIRDFFKNSKMKPWDGVIIFLLIVCSFLPLLIFSYQQSSDASAHNGTQTTAILRVSGKEVRSFTLDKNKKSYTYTYKAEDGGYNLIEVANGQIRIKEADCGDLICVQRGWISKQGETIVCLPHQLVIEINSSAGGEDGELIY